MSDKSDTTFPVDSLREAAPHLRRPFTPQAVRWKVQTGEGNSAGGHVVAYIDSRAVIERLNLVCPHLWSTVFEPYGERIDSGRLICHLTIDGKTRSDVGQGQGQTTEKAAYSDSLKRAARMFGVGLPLYAMKAVWVGATEDGSLDSNGNPTLKRVTRRQKTRLEMTPRLEAWLRSTYEKWLEARGSGQFGEPLDHGDEEGAAPTEGEADVGAPAESDEDVQLAARRQEVEALYEEKVKPSTAARKKLPVARFKAQVGSATLEELDELQKQIEEL